MNNGEVGGSRGRGRAWQNPDNKPSNLRRPKSIADDKKEPPKSKLSAEAKEWYPPNYVAQVPAVHAPDPYRVHRSSVQNRIRRAQDIDAYNFDGMSYSLKESENNVNLRENITKLINVMCEITFDPGKFDKLCGQLVDSFVTTLNDVNYTQPLVDAIVNQSIAEANFRYNGARLCSIYDSVGTPEESTFRNCLLERCLAEVNKIISGQEASEENMRGFAMFLAEIYTQLEDNQGLRIKLLGESLCKVFLHLLNTDKEANVKAVCQLLKLSGIALDADCTSSMQTTFERLQERAHLPSVRHVLALRAARWGLADPEPAPRASSPPASFSAPAAPSSAHRAPQEMVGYLADGQTLTLEECDFIENNLPPKPATLEDDILEELENDPWDMDAEMQEGFLEFLKLSKQIKR